MALEQGTLLHNRYRIIDILGQGGMGSVYRAIDENLGMEVAVKENLFTTEEYARQFRLEAVILANLRHPNLPRVTDHFVLGDQGQYLVMDYIEGEDLRQRMERLTTVAEDEVILIGAAMCDALQYLHTRKPPVLHRDIKPGNVKITPEGLVYLVDFGLAKIIQGSQATTTGARAMTPGYSPPEQYGTARTDPRSDVYSLGATLYAALTGAIPEDGLARVMDNTQLTPIRKLAPNVSRRLATAIEKAMEAYPDDRFQNAVEFKHALLGSNSKTQQLANAITVSPAPGGDGLSEVEVKPRSTPLEAISAAINTTFRRRRGRRTETPIWAYVLLTLVVLGAFAWGAWTYIPGMRAMFGDVAPVATSAFEPTTQPGFPPVGDEATPTPELTATPEPTPTPEITPTPANTPIAGSGILALASTRSGNLPQIFLVDTSGVVFQQLTEERNGACQPDWSPDGKKIVYVSPCPTRRDPQYGMFPGSSLFIIDVETRERIELPTRPGGDFQPAWSPRGDKIAFVSLRDALTDNHTQIYTIDLNTNLVTRLTETERNVPVRHPAWNRFGTQLVYSVQRLGISEIWFMNATGQSAQLLVRSGSEVTDFLPHWGVDDRIIFNQTRSDNSAPAWLMQIRYEDRASAVATRLQIGQEPVVNPDMSPDGRWLAFTSWPDPNNVNHDIYVYNFSTGEISRLTRDPAFDFDPAWKPVP
jgi:eukaryotic-like serine/threonine-protein kinase